MFTLPDLDYDYDALGKYISKNIMELHHDKHHQTYVDKVNAALEKAPELQSKSVEELLRGLDSVPEAIRNAVRNHGGGHYNHTQFWKWMSPDGGGEPGGTLGEGLKAKYGDFQGFMDAFGEKALGVFGSGWAWLQPDLTITTSPNQDSPLMSGGADPLLGLDVWEHAYYLDYTYNRGDYIKAWWHVVNWPEVERRLAAAS
ncbi:MAG TPA: superoxide dismutase [Candidatus Saccharimonadales bacterium]|jgi:Fe-Mn family superoxide dismutase|nr:superoxide dismutase [Candidatus Saccharimonadales bacterium]